MGVGLLVGLKINENSNRSGNAYAKIIYENELILMIDLETLDYQVFNTVYKDLITTTRASEGIFYVPGKVTTDMEALYQVDQFARDNEIVGIKLKIEDAKISVEYQESPRDICEFQAPTDSHLQPIVCLPNQLVINVFTNLSSEQFVPDAVLE